ncbi:MAG: hypothetical protein GKR93_08480 [Gammaproteobacteria bacterium]|nr:hypothetical protein [Gammaproteobacteria bacterium]
MKVKFLWLAVNSKATAFLEWWFEGLSSICPAFIKSSLLGNHRVLTIEFEQETAYLKYFVQSNGKARDSLKVTLSDEESKASAISWLTHRLNEPCKIILLLPDDILLTKNLQFPVAARNNIDEALKFEISRKTPFTLEQAYYDYLITNNATEDGQVTVFLAMTPRLNLDNALKSLSALQIRPDFASTQTLFTDRPDINLLPKENQPQSDKSTFSRYSFFGFTSFALLAALCVPIMEQSRYIKTIESDLLQARSDALEYSRLSKEKEELLDKINFLSNKHFSTVSSIRLLNEITVLLPDDTWVFRFSLRKNVLQIQGESANASDLIKTLELSRFFENVRFTSPTTKNNSTKRDKFHLSADVIINP